ncbi:MAG TPA: hypothetical protein VER04_04595, partial [Polyangiaceae bacterium]|nr:hypothetical protein [Polyangiaceae bacterium]
NLAQLLAARPAEYRRVFQQGADSVFSLLEEREPSRELLETPALPAFSRLVPASELHVRASLQPDRARLAVDGKRGTYWTSGRFQEQGQFFEVELDVPRPIVALEIDAPGRVMDVPVSYRVSAAKGPDDLGVVLEQSVLRFYRAQVFSPESFVLRLPFPHPIVADRLRFSVEQPVPGYYFSMHELRVYVADEARL